MYFTSITIKLFIILIIIPSYFFPQTVNIIPDENVHRLSRYRLSFGGVTILSEDNNFEFSQFFFNLSFRSSGFYKDSSSFKIRFAFEPGINGLIVAEKKYNKPGFTMFFVPYAKFGPEARITRNLHLGASLGLILASYRSDFILFPFAGINCFYLWEAGNNFFLELETGFHTTFSPNGLPYLVYLTVGIATL